MVTMSTFIAHDSINLNTPSTESGKAALTSDLIENKHILHLSCQACTDAGLHLLLVGAVAVNSCKTLHWSCA